MSAGIELLNKNMFRKYPLRASATFVSSSGEQFPLGVFSSLRLTVPYVHRNVGVSSAYYFSRVFSVTITCLDTSEPLAYFRGVVSSDFATLSAIPLVRGVSGSLICGALSAFEGFSGFFEFPPANMQVEDSCVLCLEPPPLQGFRLKNFPDKVATGHVYFSVSDPARNFNKDTTTPQQVSLSVRDSQQVLSRGDRSALYRNCLERLILRINNVAPDSNGNINIVGVAPLVVTPLLGDAEIQLGATQPICPRVENIPPAHQADPSFAKYQNVEYIGGESETPIDFANTPNIVPEYTTWPPVDLRVNE
jgi:hypothetical protein